MKIKQLEGFRRYFLVLAMLFIVLFSSSFTSAVVRTINNETGYSYLYYTNVKVGMLLKSNSYDLYIQNFTKSSSNNATVAYITHANQTIISQVNFSGNFANFGNIALLGGNRYYYIFYDAGGITYYDQYKTGYFPYDVVDASMTARWLSSSNGTVETTGIIDLGISNVSLPVIPTATINSPSNNSNYLVSTPVLFNFTTSTPSGNIFNATLFINSRFNESFSLGSTGASFISLLSPSEKNAGNTVATTLNGTYDELVTAWYNPTMNATQLMNTNTLWVPWFSSSTACAVANLHTDDWAVANMTHNSMVTDEFSQVGIGVSMGTNETRMEQFYKTLSLINGSSAGTLPSWKVKRTETLIINNIVNDTASDADARIITALYNGANNSYFSSTNRSKYFALANQMTQDFVKFDLYQSSKFSSLGLGNITYWMASGRNARDGGMASSDYAYTGYFQDGATAMLQAYLNTGNSTYLDIARNITLNYLEASKWNGVTFTTSPGKAFKWNNITGLPGVTCTNTCSPDIWDSIDAPRAYGLGETEYYFNLTGNNFTILSAYMGNFVNRYMRTYNSVPLQYYSNGTNYGTNQSGFFSQGLQSLGLIGKTNLTLYNMTLRDALSHYDSTPKSVDYTACMGVYQEAFMIKSLGEAIGRNLNSFGTSGGAGTTGSMTNTTTKYFTTGGNYNFTVQACGTLGCSNSSLQMFTISSTWIEDTVYAPTTASYGDTKLFGVNLNITGGVIINASNLVYNGLVYSIGSIDNNPNSINLTKSNFLIPSTSGVIPWYINFTFNDSTSGQITSRNVTISDVALDDCSTYTIPLYNFTAYDERALTLINATASSFNASVNAQIYDNSYTTLITNYSKQFTKTSPFRICIKNTLLTTSNYKIDLQVQFKAVNYSTEFYNIKGETLDINDLNTNISLYPLESTLSQEFKVTYKDSSFLPVENAVIQIQRKYISEGIFRTVEQPKTDVDGQVIAHLEVNNAVYTFIVLVNGQVQATFSNKIAYCPNPTFTECTISLNELSSNVDYTDFATISGLSFNLAYDTSTRTVTNIFSVLSGVPANVVMNVTFNDNFGNNTICSSTLYTSSGTLSCTIPAGFGNTSVIVDTYYNGVSIGQTVISMAQDPSAIYVGSRVLIGLVMILSLVGISLVGIPVITGIFLIIALIMLVMLNIVASTGMIGAGATMLWFVIAVILVIFRGGNR